jgi:hypothetical protein
VDVVDLAQAEAFKDPAQPQLDDGFEAKKWHCLEGPGGTPLVCLQSLLKSM